MATKTTKTVETNDDVLDIEQFFSRDNEENGVWYEPTVKGLKVGFEVKVMGPNSNTVAIADEEFAKSRDAINEIEDLKERSDKMNQAVALRFSKYICDIRGVNGKKLVRKDKEVTVKDVYDILYNSPSLAMDISRFAMRQDNFLGIKKNS